MKIVGIIAEYNPFHNGHLFHLEKVKEISKPDLIIAIITGYFSMRGEASVLNKKQKTDICLTYGIDLVIELPMVFGTHYADIFCQKSVELLRLIGVSDIYAGSESNDMSLLKSLLNCMKQLEFQKKVHNLVLLGHSIAYASRFVAQSYGYQISTNDMLNVKYLEACGDAIQFHTILREHSSYHDKVPTHKRIASATAIRSMQDFQTFVPERTAILTKEKPFYSTEAFTKFLQYKLASSSMIELQNSFLMEEGLEHAFSQAKFQSIAELVETFTSKRYTATKLYRTIAYLIANITKQEMSTFLLERNYPIRILGFNMRGQAYLNSIKKETFFFTNMKHGIHPIYDIELRLATIFSVIFEEDFISLEQSLPLILK